MRFDRLDLNLLVALDALIEERSVSAAAKRLHLSQPALSGALQRLREYFDDELLVQAGRQMVPTPTAERLAGAVRQSLLQIRANITTSSAFDPASAERRFTVVASDYVYNVLLADVVTRATADAPGVTFDVIAPDRRAHERLDRGEADLVITLSSYLQEGHPRTCLFGDEPAVVCWAEGMHRDGIDAQAFLAAGHAVAVFGPDRYPAFTEILFEREGVSRRIEVRVPTQTALPQAVLGTNRVATMYQRHAEHFARAYPIVIHPMPVEVPSITEYAQWHHMRAKDQGLHWLVGLLEQGAGSMV